MLSFFSDRARKASKDSNMSRNRSASVTKAASVANINQDAPIILFMGEWDCLLKSNYFNRWSWWGKN
jgi:hypothetical protein